MPVIEGGLTQRQHSINIDPGLSLGERVVSCKKEIHVRQNKSCQPVMVVGADNLRRVRQYFGAVAGKGIFGTWDEIIGTLFLRT